MAVKHKFAKLGLSRLILSQGCDCIEKSCKANAPISAKF